jgi:cytochrome b involved in lipid metabolism
MNDLWVGIYDKIYNLTNFLNIHPGGVKALRGVAGTDATRKFEEMGHGKLHLIQVKKYIVADLINGEKNPHDLSN